MHQTNAYKRVCAPSGLRQGNLSRCLRLLALLLGVTLFAPGALEAAQQNLNIPFNPGSAQIRSSDQSYTFADFQSLELPSGLTLAVETIVIPLSGAGELPQVSVTVGEMTLVGIVDPAASLIVDIATADDDRYRDAQPALGQLFTGGWSPWKNARVVAADNGGYIEALISPFAIDSAGAVFLLSDLEFTVTGGSSLTLSPALTGAAAQDFLRNSANPSGSASRNSRSTMSMVDFVIVTNEELQPEMERLASYRRSTGTATEVVLIEDILPVFDGVDDAVRLREYLKTRYATGVRYVLLAGDEMVVPIRYAYYYNTSTPPAVENLMICDLYFADLNGEWDVDGDGIWGEPTHDLPDLTPELYLGRLPISEIWQAKNYIDKLILYETNPGNGDPSYLTRSLIFSSDQMRDFSGGGQHAVLAGAMPDYVTIDTTGVVETPNGSDPAPANLSGASSIDKLSEGYGIVNVIAHGRHDGFAVRTANYNEWPKSYILSTEESSDHGSLDSLTQNGFVGLYVALSCDLGGFDMDAPPFTTTSRSFAESVVSTANSGAIGMIAYSRWGWVYSSYHLHREFLAQLYGASEGSSIAAMYASSALYPYYRDLIYGQNYVGDPTVRIHLQQPEKFELSLQAGAWSDGEVSAVLSLNGAPVSGQRALLSQDGVVISESQTGADGSVLFLAEFTLGSEYTIAVIPDDGLTALASFTPTIVTGAEVDTDPALPGEFELHQNFPNPFNPSTVISWELPERAEVDLVVYDILGRTVDQVSFGSQSPGSYQFDWTLQTQTGQALASGVYLYQIRAGEFTQTRKMTALK